MAHADHSRTLFINRSDRKIHKVPLFYITASIQFLYEPIHSRKYIKSNE